MTQTYPIATPDPLSDVALLKAARKLFTRLVLDESGQDMIEYALVAAFLGLATVTGLHGLASSISNYLNIILNAFISATGG